MSGSVVNQPPYLDLAQAATSADVQMVAEMAAMRVAMLVLQAGGGPVLTEPVSLALSDATKGARVTLARAVLARKIPRDLMALALLQAPDIAGAIVSDKSNPASAMMSVDVAAAWARNWSDFAMIIQAQ